jgi:hypothetical protein
MLLFGINEKSRLDKNTSVVVCHALFLFLLLLSVFKEKILPGYFFTDADTIYEFFGAPFDLGSSYSATAKFYEFFGVDRDSWLFSIFSITYIYFFSLYFIRKSFSVTVYFPSLFVAVFFLFLSVVYMTLLSKDFIVFVLLSVFFVICNNSKIYMLIWVVFVLLYAYYFRNYWIIFLFNFLCLTILYKFGFKLKSIMLFSFGLIFVLAFSYFFLLGENIDSFRVVYNESRADRGIEASNTMILPWFGIGGFFQSWLNSSVTWVSFFIPLNLALLGSVYYLTISFLIVYTFYYFFRGLAKSISARDDFGAYSGLIVVSFTLVQAVFEPDYGSFIRHITPFFPLIVFVIQKNFIGGFK